MKRTIIILAVVCLFFTDEDQRLREVGIACSAVTYGGLLIAQSPKGADDMIYTSYYLSTGTRLIGYSPSTGEKLRLSIPSEGGYGLTKDAKGNVYIGGVSPGDLYCFQPETGKLSTIESSRFGIEYIWDLEPSRDGRYIYGATYPNCSILQYDTVTGSLSDSGRLVPNTGEDINKNWNKCITVDKYGRIWAGLGTKAELVVYDPATGARETLLPPSVKQCTMVKSILASGDYVLAITNNPGFLLLFDVDSGKLIRTFSKKKVFTWHVADSGDDGIFYLSTNPDYDLVKLDAKELRLSVIRKKFGKPARVLRNRYVYGFGLDEYFIIYDISKNAILERYKMPQPTTGMRICTLAAAPDGRIYGSTYKNQQIYFYDRERREITNLGKVLRWPGQVDSLCPTDDGRLYFGAYINAVLGVYDPRMPWDPGRKRSSNPLELGPVGHGQYRTNAMVKGPDGNFYVATRPSYETAELGGLARYNPKTGKIDFWDTFTNSNYGIIWDLKADKDWLYARALDEFLIIDVRRMKKVFSERFRVYEFELSSKHRIVLSEPRGITIFNTKAQRFEKTVPSPVGRLVRMAPLPNGNVAAMNANAIVEIDPLSGEIRVLASEGGDLITADPEGNIYVSRAERLYVLRQRGD